ncbi:MAG: hypothetical protein Q7T71_07655 [Herbiconiux sp.]|nr:hypothetical protein [Herbiconiux sp.]
MSQSEIENQISSATGLPITSAALRYHGVLVTDVDTALDLAIELHEERTPGLRTIFVKDLRKRVPLADHSTIVKLDGDHLTLLRGGSVDPDDVEKEARRSNHGVDWSDAT